LAIWQGSRQIGEKKKGGEEQKGEEDDDRRARTQVSFGAHFVLTLKYTLLNLICVSVSQLQPGSTVKTWPMVKKNQKKSEELRNSYYEAINHSSRLPA
jgi:hypothetical protein